MFKNLIYNGSFIPTNLLLNYIAPKLATTNNVENIFITDIYKAHLYIYFLASSWKIL